MTKQDSFPNPGPHFGYIIDNNNNVQYEKKRLYISFKVSVWTSLQPELTNCVTFFSSSFL